MDLFPLLPSCLPFMKHKEESSLRNSLCREFLRDLVRRHRDEREFFTTGKTVVQFTRIYLFFFYMRARTFRFDQFRGREIRFFEKIERG